MSNNIGEDILRFLLDDGSDIAAIHAQKIYMYFYDYIYELAKIGNTFKPKLHTQLTAKAIQMALNTPLQDTYPEIIEGSEIVLKKCFVENVEASLLAERSSFFIDYAKTVAEDMHDVTEELCVSGVFDKLVV